MSKRAISVTLMPENLLWLRARARRTRSRSVSAALDALLNEMRQGTNEPRSVVGRVRFPGGEAGLKAGEREIRELFERALEGRPHKGPSSRRRG